MDASVERRGASRVRAAEAPWGERAMLRPGHEVTLIDVGPGGVLMQTSARVLPGKRVDLQLAARDGRRVAAGRVLRCRVVRLCPAIYEAAVAFDQRLLEVAGDG